MSKTAKPRPATVGEPFTYTLKETNKTNSPVTVTVTDNLPSNVEFSDFGGFLNDNPGSCGASSGPGGTVTCTFELPAKKSKGKPFQGIRLRVTTTEAGQVTNTATDDQGNQSSVTECVKTPGGGECPHHRHG